MWPARQSSWQSEATMQPQEWRARRPQNSGFKICTAPSKPAPHHKRHPGHREGVVHHRVLPLLSHLRRQEPEAGRAHRWHCTAQAEPPGS